MNSSLKTAAKCVLAFAALSIGLTLSLIVTSTGFAWISVSLEHALIHPH